MARLQIQEITDRFETYAQAVAWVEEQERKKALRPVKSSGLNGKYPSLYKVYQTCKERKEYSSLVQELENTIMPPLSSAWYLRHLAQYEKDRPYVLALNAWVLAHGLPSSHIPVSVNEASFEIFGQEKYLKSTQQALLHRLGLPEDFFNCYPTFEPLINWYSISEKAGQNILIVENLDPFVSLRKYLMSTKGNVLGVPISTIFYGAGKRILASFADLESFGFDWLKDDANTIYYLGDLDFEGIAIYTALANSWPGRNIQPFCPGYACMLQKARKRSTLPQTAKGQKPADMDFFLHQLRPKLETEDLQFLMDLLESRKYVPQEIITCADLLQAEKGKTYER